jgi:hypothetical protein
MAALVRQGAVRIEGRRAGQSGVAGQAYVITDKGIQILRGEIALKTNPPLKKWEQRHILREWCKRIANGNYSEALRNEIAQAIADYYRSASEE